MRFSHTLAAAAAAALFAGPFGAAPAAACTCGQPSTLINDTQRSICAGLGTQSLQNTAKGVIGQTLGPNALRLDPAGPFLSEGGFLDLAWLTANPVDQMLRMLGEGAAAAGKPDESYGALAQVGAYLALSDEERAAAVKTTRRRRARFPEQQILLARKPIAEYQELDKVGNLLGMSDAERKLLIAMKRQDEAWEEYVNALGEWEKTDEYSAFQKETPAIWLAAYNEFMNDEEFILRYPDEDVRAERAGEQADTKVFEEGTQRFNSTPERKAVRQKYRLNS